MSVHANKEAAPKKAALKHSKKEKAPAKKVEKKKSRLSKILTAEGWKNLLLGKFRKK